MADRGGRLGGLVLFLGAAQFSVGLMAAAARTPGYSIANDTISALGTQEGAIVFNLSIVLLGILVVASAYFVRSVWPTRVLPLLLALAGIGALGVGVFPADTPIQGVHGAFALLVFLSSNVAAIYAARVLPTPLRQVSVVLGAIGLVALALFLSGIYLGIGIGGMERMIVLPVLAWSLGFGGHLMGGSGTDRTG